MNEDWGNDPRHAPKLSLEEGDEILFSEHGRVLNNVCYRAFYFSLVKDQYGGHALCVSHGAGEERINGHHFRLAVAAMKNLDSDNRFRLMFALFDQHRESKRAGRNEAITTYQNAFVEGRLKKRKLPKQNRVKVWIVPMERVA